MAVSLTTAASRAYAAPKRQPEGNSEGFVDQGDAAVTRGDYEEAIAKYSAAYYGLSADERASYMGSIPVRKAMEAYDLLFEQKKERAVLDQQLAFLDRFLGDVESRPDGVERVGGELVSELKAVREAVEKKRATFDAPKDPEPEPPVASEPVGGPTEPDLEPKPDPGPTSDEGSDRGAPRNPLGIGLAVGGGVALGTGAGVMAGWWTVRNQAIDYADEEPGYEEGTTARTDYLAREEARARKYLIAGAVVMGVGAAVAITGVVLVARKPGGKRKHVAIAPQLGPSNAGFVLSGRF